MYLHDESECLYFSDAGSIVGVAVITQNCDLAAGESCNVEVVIETPTDDNPAYFVMDPPYLMNSVPYPQGDTNECDSDNNYIPLISPQSQGITSF